MSMTDGESVAELQGTHQAQPIPGMDVDLFTGETAPAPSRRGGDDRQLSMF